MGASRLSAIDYQRIAKSYARQARYVRDVLQGDRLPPRSRLNHMLMFRRFADNASFSYRMARKEMGIE